VRAKEQKQRQTAAKTGLEAWACVVLRICERLEGCDKLTKQIGEASGGDDLSTSHHHAFNSPLK